MSNSWCVIVSAFAVLGALHPTVSSSERGAACLALVCAVVLGRRGAKGLLLCGALLGAIGALRMDRAFDAARGWATFDGWAHVEVVGRSDEVLDVRLGARGQRPVRGRLRWSAVQGKPPGAGDLPRRMVARVRIGPWTDVRNPDDRRRAWGWWARRSLVRGRILTVAAREGEWKPGRVELLRAEIVDWSNRRLGGSAALWRALLLGEGSALGTDQRRPIQELGLAHLLALSGLHVGIVLGALLWPWRRRARRVLPLLLPVLAAWLWVAGSGASLTRAVTMVALATFAQQRRRVARAEDVVGGACLLELTLRPWVLGGIGWWLSYAATLAIVRGAPWLRGRPWWQAGLGVSVLAQLGTLPWILDAFGRLPLWSAPIQLVFGPAFAVLLVLGMACLFVAACVPPLASIAIAGLQLASHGFGGLVALAAPRFSAALHHPGLPDGAWAVAMVLAAVGLAPSRRWRRLRIGIVVTGLVLVHVGGAPEHEWISFDVDQGDAGVYRCGRARLVIDAGPYAPDYVPAERSLVPWLERRRRGRTTLLLTHGHLDHTGGVGALLAEGLVDRVVVARADRDETWVRRLGAACARVAVPLEFVAAGDTLVVGHCRVPVLWPAPDLDVHEKNDRSVVVALGPSRAALLAGGDLERGAEERLLERLPPRRWRILKVAHHGGDTGTEQALLAALKVRLAIVSCGHGNRYGHPHPACLARLRRAGALVARTDRVGAVIVRWPDHDGTWTWTSVAAAGRP